MSTPAPADSSTAYFAELAVPALALAQRQALDDQGFVVLPGVIDAAWLEALRTRVDAQVASEGAAAGHEVHQEPGTIRLADLVNKDQVFDRVWSHPLLVACVRHMLGRPGKLSSLNAREARPGAGHQGLHADWGGRIVGEPFHVANSLWLLDDYGDNGATRLVPGSHRLPGSVTDHVADPQAPHPDEIVLQAPAGTVVVMNAHLWHGGTINRSGARRRVVHCYWTGREHAQQLDQAAYIRLRTWRRLTPAQRWLLDVPVT